MHIHTTLFCVLAVISLAVIVKCDEPVTAAPAAEDTPDATGAGDAAEPTEKPEISETPETSTTPGTTATPETSEKPTEPASVQPPSVQPPSVQPPSVQPPSVQPPVPSGEGGTGTVALEYLQLHNEARKKEKLSDLAWDDGLAGKAKTIVESCKKQKEVFNDYFNVEFTRSKKANPKSTFSAWLRQGKRVKKGDTSKCCNQKRRTCCRYAKVISPKYKNVGCASNFCKKLTDGRRSNPSFGTACVYS